MERAQIIEKLKALNEGDYLVGTGERSYYNECEKYYVKVDECGDKYVVDETNDREFINIGDDYDCTIIERIADGCLVFGEINPKIFAIDSYGSNDGSIKISLTTDNIGFERLKQLESEVKRASEIATLERQLDEIQRKIDELKANGGRA